MEDSMKETPTTQEKAWIVESSWSDGIVFATTYLDTFQKADKLIDELKKVNPHMVNKCYLNLRYKGKNEQINR